LEDHLFRRLFPTGFGSDPKIFAKRLSAEIGSSIACLVFLPLPALRRGGDFRPDHSATMDGLRDSGKREMDARPCG
jgi:hypothetical protein